MGEASAIPDEHNDGLMEQEGRARARFCLYNRKRELWVSVYPSLTGLSGHSVIKIDQVPAQLRTIDWEAFPYALSWSTRPVQYFDKIRDVDWLVANVFRLEKNPYAVYWIYSSKVPLASSSVPVLVGNNNDHEPV